MKQRLRKLTLEVPAESSPPERPLRCPPFAHPMPTPTRYLWEVRVLCTIQYPLNEKGERLDWLEDTTTVEFTLNCMENCSVDNYNTNAQCFFFYVTAMLDPRSRRGALDEINSVHRQVTDACKEVAAAVAPFWHSKQVYDLYTRAHSQWEDAERFRLQCVHRIKKDGTVQRRLVLT
jgi:hypothetical protein